MRIFYFDSLPSTQDKVKEIIKAGSRDSAFAVCAKRQTAGYGKQGRNFYSPKQGLYITIALKNFDINNSMATLAIGTAIADFLVSFSENYRIRLKWVNDLYLDNKKFGGILTERVSDYLVIGIGLNLAKQNFPDDLKKKATFLDLGGDVDASFVEKIVQCVEKSVKTNSNNKFLDRYRELDFLKGKKVLVKMSHKYLTGTACGIDNKGRLILKTNSSLYALNSGDVIKILF